ncbi:hypothetical protein C8Q77DRAFT_1118232 [Trametes polyzona]|nr:hypothetical protein C8Q77DRAFT_1118232 [Trametes polyzona]
MMFERRGPLVVVLFRYLAANCSSVLRFYAQLTIQIVHPCFQNLAAVLLQEDHLSAW